VVAFDGERFMARSSQPIDAKPPPPKRRRVWRWFRHLARLSLGLTVGLFIAVVLWPYVVITVPSGSVGVLWKRLNGFDIYCWCFVGRGTVLDPRNLRDEGLHIIAPWDKIFIYNLRLQSKTETINAISKDGVNVLAQINVRFQLQHDSVGVLHKFLGPAYMSTVVMPEIGSRGRAIISLYSAQEVYTSRESIQSQIRDGAKKYLRDHLNALIQMEAMEQPDPKHYYDFLQNSIRILDTLVLSIELPPAIVAAINRQTQQFYQIQEYKFRVQREAEESKRKQIEANGIAAFQRTVSKGISESYLRWRGIEATLALAKSQNSKIVIIGAGKDGLPIILGNVDSPSSTPGSGTNGTVSSPGGKSIPSVAAPPGTSPTVPGNKSPSNGTELKPPAGQSSDLTSTTPSNNSAAVSSAAPLIPNQPSSSSGPLDLSTIKDIISRIPESFRLKKPPSHPETGAPTQK